MCHSDHFASGAMRDSSLGPFSTNRDSVLHLSIYLIQHGDLKTTEKKGKIGRMYMNLCMYVIVCMHMSVGGVWCVGGWMGGWESWVTFQFTIVSIVQGEQLLLVLVWVEFGLRCEHAQAGRFGESGRASASCCSFFNSFWSSSLRDK